ncbi:MAG TPA: Ca2+-dependent phosphoinositide-specific phospholipase C, partial [Steroidobacteraceae bacterium]|nr:Ca2+-dependent phosphoinositide-specific phospholipase C [Steroidobacteraceae bacterium]
MTAFMRCVLAAISCFLFASAYADTQCNLRASQAPAGDEECVRAWMDENLRANDLLSIGTHNSYKDAIPDTEMKELRSRSQRAATVLDYSHPDLAKQLDAGARQLELDVYYDPHGGRFADPLAPRQQGRKLHETLLAELAKPGFKVMHIPDFDFRSTCIRFVACLQAIKTWSDAHPDHIPIAIL